MFYFRPERYMLSVFLRVVDIFLQAALKNVNSVWLLFPAHCMVHPRR